MKNYSKLLSAAVMISALRVKFGAVCFYNAIMQPKDADREMDYLLFYVLFSSILVISGWMKG